MADYYYGEISFPEWALNLMEVREQLADYGFIDYVDQPINEFENSCQALTIASEIVTLRNWETKDGEYSDLERVLMENKVPFTRQSDPFIEYERRLKYYRPASNLSDQIYTELLLDEDGEVCVPFNKLEALLNSNNLKADLEQLLIQYGLKIPSLMEYITK